MADEEAPLLSPLTDAYGATNDNNGKSDDEGLARGAGYVSDTAAMRASARIAANSLRILPLRTAAERVRIRRGQKPYTFSRKHRGGIRRRKSAQLQESGGRIAVHCRSRQIHLGRLSRAISAEAASKPAAPPTPTKRRYSQFEASEEKPNWEKTVFLDAVLLRPALPESEVERLQSRQGRSARDYTTEDDEEEFGGVVACGPMVRPECFVFSYGCVVFWGFRASEENAFMNSLEAFSDDRIHPDASASAADDMVYFHGRSSDVRHDRVELASDDAAERLAVSFAFAQSCLLSVFEYRLERAVERNENIPAMLAATGNIKMKKKDISKEIGRLFIERYSINLDSESVLDEPSHFWDHDEWLETYKRVRLYLDNAKRVELLNHRLDCINDLLGVLNSQVEDSHASRLEWIIIILIAIEIIMSMFWNTLHFFYK